MMVWGLKVPSMGLMTKILVIVFKSSSFCLLCCLFSGIQCWAFWLFDCNGWQRNKRKGKSQRGKSCWDKKIKKACQAKVGLRIWSGEGNWLQKCTHGKLMIFFWIGFVAAVLQAVVLYSIGLLYLCCLIYFGWWSV